eukprot:889479-Rhodomonas_salina.1
MCTNSSTSTPDTKSRLVQKRFTSVLYAAGEAPSHGTPLRTLWVHSPSALRAQRGRSVTSHRSSRGPCSAVTAASCVQSDCNDRSALEGLGKMRNMSPAPVSAAAHTSVRADAWKPKRRSPDSAASKQAS